MEIEQIEHTRPTCCLSRLWDKTKNKGLVVELTDHLDVDDVVWLKSRDECRYRAIDYLLSSTNASFKLAKIHGQKGLLVCFPVEISEVNPDDVFPASKPNFWQCIGKKMLKKCRLRVAHAAWTLLYDIDLSVSDTDLLGQHAQPNKAVVMARGLANLGKRLNAKIVTLPLGSQATDSIDGELLELGYELPMNDFTMQLNISKDWGSFSQYAENLKKKYRKRALDIRNKALELEFRELDAEEIADRQLELYGLYLQVVDRQKFIYAKASVDHFTAMKYIFGDNFTIEGVFHGEKMMAFISYLKQSGGINIHYIGLYYSFNEQFDLYFNLLFRGLELGICSQSTFVNFGRTSLDAKASLGAVPVYQQVYVKSIDLPKGIMKAIAGQLSDLEGDHWKLRQPFKGVE